MSTQAIAPVENTIDDKSLFSLVTDGDASKLSDAQKLAYYKARCEAAGLDARAQPFQFLRLNGKLVLYALKACTDQLAAKHGIRCEILSQQTDDGIRVVTVRAIAKDGRQTDEIGAVGVKGLQGEALCNAYMKAATKAKRRATLAICGLGMLDETELDTIPTAKPEPTVIMPRRLSEARRDDGTSGGDSVRTAGGDRAVGVRGDAARDDLRGGDAQVVEAEVVAEPAAETEDDIEALLRASIDAQQAKADDPKITEADRRYLEKLRNDSGHDRNDVKRWLARRGFMSSKDITVSAFAAIRDRLSDPTPLEV